MQRKFLLILQYSSKKKYATKDGERAEHIQFDQFGNYINFTDSWHAAAICIQQRPDSQHDKSDQALVKYW